MIDTSWLKISKPGLYVPPAYAHIDPVRAVDTAIITHGHADHARAGHGHVIATPETLAIMSARYGANFAAQQTALPYNQQLMLGDVNVKLIPAGHVLGSAQIVLEYANTKIIAAGDYKRRSDPTCRPFQVEHCDVFITEATFGLPVFAHPEPETQIKKLLEVKHLFPERSIIIGAYSLGKAQRLIALLREAGYDETIFIHGAMKKLCELYISFGIELGSLQTTPIGKIDNQQISLAGKFILAPPSAMGTKWAQRLSDPLVVSASGWMQVRQRAKQGGVELPLVISDHADWNDILRTIKEVNASEIWVTHGREDALIHACSQMGLSAKALSLIGYEDESE
jgi:putative mRNA 3-end processing factor